VLSLSQARIPCVGGSGDRGSGDGGSGDGGSGDEDIDSSGNLFMGLFGLKDGIVIGIGLTSLILGLLLSVLTQVGVVRGEGQLGRGRPSMPVYFSMG